MKTPIPVIHTFNEVNVGKSKTVQYFEINNIKNGTNKLSKELNISIDRGFSRRTPPPKFWVKLRGLKKWIDPALTGLFSTKHRGVYFGDMDNKKHLLIFNFNNDSSKLDVHYFEDYYSTNLTQVFNTLSHV